MGGLLLSPQCPYAVHRSVGERWISLYELFRNVPRLWTAAEYLDHRGPRGFDGHPSDAESLSDPARKNPLHCRCTEA